MSANEAEDTVAGSPSVDATTKAYMSMWAEAFRLYIDDALKDMRASYRRTVNTEWLYGKSHKPGSFLWLCHLFNFDPDQARRRIQEKAKNGYTRGPYKKRSANQ